MQGAARQTAAAEEHRGCGAIVGPADPCERTGGVYNIAVWMQKKRKRPRTGAGRMTTHPVQVGVAPTYGQQSEGGRAAAGQLSRLQLAAKATLVGSTQRICAKVFNCCAARGLAVCAVEGVSSLPRRRFRRAHARAWHASPLQALLGPLFDPASGVTRWFHALLRLPAMAMAAPGMHNNEFFSPLAHGMGRPVCTGSLSR